MQKNPLSQKIYAEATRLTPGGVNSPVRAFRNVGGQPFFVKRAKGARIEDVDGNSYLDYIGSWGPNILGHAPPILTNTLHEVAKDGISYGIPNLYEVEMARLICDWVPSVDMVRMVNSGTEATMSAIRLARGVTGRDKLVKFAGCYHGHSDSLLVAAGSGALTHGKPDSAGVPASIAADTLVLPFNDLERLEELFATRGSELAAVILEPYPANAGLIFPRPGYLQKLRQLCHQHGTLCIFDEVMTGFRLAPGGVQELLNLKPDLTALGKVIGGGLPVGAFGGRADLMQHLAPEGPVYQAGTLSGNPLAMAAGLAQLRELEKQHAYHRLEQLGAHLEHGLRTLLLEQGIPHQLHRAGSMFCLYFCEHQIWNLQDVLNQDLTHFRKFFHACLDRGVYLAPSPYETAFLSLAHSEADLDQTLDIIASALQTL